MALELYSKGKLSVQEAREALERAISGFLGASEAAKAGMQIIELIKVKEAENHKDLAARGILSINRKYALKVRAALVLLKEIEGKQVMARVRGVSGTLRKLREKFLD